MTKSIMEPERTAAELESAARSLIDTLLNTLRDRAKEDAQLDPFVRGLNEVSTEALQNGPLPKLDHPAMNLLNTCLASGDGPLFQAVQRAAHVMDWKQVFAGGGISPELANGMFAAQAVGNYGCFPGESLAAGLFLLAPGVHYPLHTHAATEIYYCVSGTLSIQHGVDAEPFDLTADAYSVTPSHQLHSLQTGDNPVLLIYAWEGEIVCDNWWWSRNSDDTWTRTAWVRLPGKSWEPTRQEPVTEAHRVQANADGNRQN